MTKNKQLQVQSCVAGLTLEGDSGEKVALWLLTSLCTSAKREVEVALFVFCLFVLNKPFSDSLFCRADNKGTDMIVNYCPINNK
jgi:hypothetical protein